MKQFRKSDYWDDYSDDDLKSLELSYSKLMQNCTNEIASIHRELDKRHQYDLAENQHDVLIEGFCYETGGTY